jgi:hypothetical protein
MIPNNEENALEIHQISFNNDLEIKIYIIFCLYTRSRLCVLFFIGFAAKYAIIIYISLYVPLFFSNG